MCEIVILLCLNSICDWIMEKENTDDSDSSELQSSGTEYIPGRTETKEATEKKEDSDRKKRKCEPKKNAIGKYILFIKQNRRVLESMSLGMRISFGGSCV